MFFFPYQELPQTTKISQWISPVLWFKKFRRKNVISPSLIHKNISLRQFSWNTEEFPNKLFASVRPKIIDGRTWYPLSIQEMFSLPEALWKMELNPKKVYGNVRQKKSTEKPDIPLSHPYQLFSAWNFSKQRRVLNEPFGELNQKSETEFCDNLRLFHISFPMPENFWNTERVPK